MSDAARAWAYQQTVKHCGAKFILVTLADGADPDGFVWLPGQLFLTAATGQSIRSVRRHMKYIEAAGLIQRATRGYMRGFLVNPPARKVAA